MAWENRTNLTEFLLLGLSQSWEIQRLLFICFLFLYVSALFNNIVILLAIIRDPRLFNSPMFFFLGHLAFLDLCMANVTIPRAIVDFLIQRQAISFQDCMAQLFFLHFFGGSEMLLLMLMAYDRYVAICHPLHYTSRMSRRHCVGFILVAWTGGLLHTSVQLGFTINAPFCGPNRVDNFFCDVPLLIKLACIDNYNLEVMMVTNSGVMSLVGFVSLILSYGLILSTICSRSTSEGTAKAISTCTSHLIVVTMFFGPCIFIYLRPYTRYVFDKVLSVFYIAVTPTVNPTVYALKNKEMKAAIGRLLARHSGVVSIQIAPVHSGRLAGWKHKKIHLPFRLSIISGS